MTNPPAVARAHSRTAFASNAALPYAQPAATKTLGTPPVRQPNMPLCVIGDESASCRPCTQPHRICIQRCTSVRPAPPQQRRAARLPPVNRTCLPASWATNPPAAARAYSRPSPQQRRTAFSRRCHAGSPCWRLGITPSAHHAALLPTKRTCSPRRRRRIRHLLPAHTACPRCSKDALHSPASAPPILHVGIWESLRRHTTRRPRSPNGLALRATGDESSSCYLRT